MNKFEDCLRIEFAKSLVQEYYQDYNEMFGRIILAQVGANRPKIKKVTI